MSVVPFRHYPLDRESPWSFTASEGNALLEAAGWGGYKAAHTIFDSAGGSIPETKDSYLLPHHKLKNGNMTTFFRGVVAAAAALVGARGGVNASQADKRAAARHLIQHYREFEVDPPESLLELAGGRRMSDSTLKTPYEMPLPAYSAKFDENMSPAERFVNLAKALLRLEGLDANVVETIRGALAAIHEGGHVTPDAIRTILKTARERQVHFVGRPVNGEPSVIVSTDVVLGLSKDAYPIPQAMEFSTALGKKPESKYPYPFAKLTDEKWKDVPKPASFCEFGKNCVAVEGEGESASFCSAKVTECHHALEFGCPDNLDQVSSFIPGEASNYSTEIPVDITGEGSEVTQVVNCSWDKGTKTLRGFYRTSVDEPVEGFTFELEVDPSATGEFVVDFNQGDSTFKATFSLDAPLKDAEEYLNGAPGQIVSDFLAEQTKDELAESIVETPTEDPEEEPPAPEPEPELEPEPEPEPEPAPESCQEPEDEAAKAADVLKEVWGMDFKANAGHDTDGVNSKPISPNYEPLAQEVAAEFAAMPDIARAPTFAVPDVEVFDTGAWHGEPWTVADLDEMVRNAHRLRLTIKPPVKLGHSNQILERSADDDSLPAVGWIENIRRIGTKILADFTNVPKVVFDLIMKGAYKRVSSEILLDYTDRKTGEHFGKVLRAVSLLGAAIPEVKTLRDVAALYSDQIQEADPGMHTEVFNFTVEGGKIVDNDSKLQAKLEEKDALLAERDKDLADKEAAIQAEKEAAAQAEQTKAEIEANFAAEKEALLAQLKEQNELLAKVQEQHRIERRETRARETEAFFGELTSKGILAPSHKDQVTAIIAAAYELQDEAGLEKVAAFSENVDGGSVVEGIKTFLKALPNQIDFSERTGNASAAQSDGSPAGAPPASEISEELSRNVEEQKIVNFTDYRGDTTPMTSLSLQDKFKEIRKANPGLSAEEAMVLAEKSLG